MAKKKKKEEVKVDMKAIKEMESAFREAAVEMKIKEEVKPDLVSFDTWWFMRSKKIPTIHAKEIIAVDFRSRGLKELELIETFDEALTKYGIML